MRLEFKKRFDIPVGKLFAYHETPANLARLLEDWKTFRLVAHEGNIRVGSITRIEERVGFSWVPMTFEHFVYEPPRRFGERMTRGPFLKFEHIHEFESDGSGTLVRDRLEVLLPWYRGGEWTVKHFVAPKLGKFFAYRHAKMEQLIRDEVVR